MNIDSIIFLSILGTLIVAGFILKVIQARKERQGNEYSKKQHSYFKGQESKNLFDDFVC